MDFIHKLALCTFFALFLAQKINGLKSNTLKMHNAQMSEMTSHFLKT